RSGIRGLALDERLAAVGLGKIRAGVRMRVIDDGEREPLVDQAIEPQRVERVHIVCVAGRARERHGIARVHLVLHVATWHVATLRASDENDAAALVGVFLDGLALDRRQLLGRDQHAPPANAGMITTSSPSFSGVPRPSMASLLT